MKMTKRLFIVTFLVILLSVTAVSVWAAPGRQGTIPIVPQESTVKLSETLNFGTGTVKVTATNCISGTLTVKKVEDPAKNIGPATLGWNFMPNQGLDITITGCSETSIQICVPQTPDMDKKTMVFNYYDSAKKEWVPITTVTSPGTPPTICGTSAFPGVYALLGK